MRPPGPYKRPGDRWGPSGAGDQIRFERKCLADGGGGDKVANKWPLSEATSCAVPLGGDNCFRRGRDHQSPGGGNKTPDCVRRPQADRRRRPTVDFVSAAGCSIGAVVVAGAAAGGRQRVLGGRRLADSTIRSHSHFHSASAAAPTAATNSGEQFESSLRAAPAPDQQVAARALGACAANANAARVREAQRRPRRRRQPTDCLEELLVESERITAGPTGSRRPLSLPVRAAGSTRRAAESWNCSIVALARIASRRETRVRRASCKRRKSTRPPAQEAHSRPGQPARGHTDQADPTEQAKQTTQHKTPRELP